jgi:dinuclear metal center YbgI/SA1388 family protein
VHTERLHSFLLRVMITPRVSDIVGIINVIAPFSLAEEWDNAGLQVGNPAAPAGKIMVALDAGRGAVEAAVGASCQLLLTHHPMIFRPLKKISIADPLGRLLALAIRNDLAIISLHTNFDIAEGGVNDLLAERLGVSHCEPLKVTFVEDLVKLSVFVPKGYEERVMHALFSFSGFIGNYSDCSFQTGGIGTFKPLQGAEPFLGEIGKREYTEEIRLEVLLRKGDLNAAVKSLLAAHPYEEPAFDLYPLLNKGKKSGLGRMGELSAALPLADFAATVKERLGLDGVRFVGDAERVVRKIALCGGSGAQLLRDAGKQGADVLVTGDVKYHEAREAEELGLALVDAGHFATELPMVWGLTELLGEELAKKGYAAEITAFEGEREPFRFI